MSARPHAPGTCAGHGPGAFRPGWCHPCWKAANPGTYQGKGSVAGNTPPNRQSGKLVSLSVCEYRGDVSARVDAAGKPCGCGAQWRYDCSIHGKCSPTSGRNGVKCCESCGDFVTDASPSDARRHLLYFIYPVADRREVWQSNIDQLQERLSLFNGRRVVAISTGGLKRPLDSVADVMFYFGKDEADFIDVPIITRLRSDGTLKEPRIGEPAAWVALMDRVKHFQRDDDYTFYAHTKAVKYGLESPAWRWAKMMYQINLDHWPIAHEILQTHPMAGGFRSEMRGHHYAGTFFWMRNRDVFAREWRKVQMCYGGVERWPGDHFKPHELGNIFGSAVGMNLYKPHVMDEQERAYEMFRSQMAR